ncbi:unnamed protein product [Symbiodinium sp. CCMP2592]|nr:unnamed protein product [Symbiodinium sp. CCMP2592]CAE7447557.1 unnamed protein product [Symbiodinium sp. CCMP2592]CAE7458951.1 unnamed protein product [Symbiodinium sp. CCMP2592]CAE7477379.1 unnamed protein product [Symbiodinium sp. CCMP2592]CAE7503923.1 unnamed protein product [Symbiodinium sp. CCMP2592]
MFENRGHDGQDSGGVIVPFGAEFNYPSMSNLEAVGASKEGLFIMHFQRLLCQLRYCHEFYKGYIHTTWDVRGKWPKNVADSKGRHMSPDNAVAFALEEEDQGFDAFVAGLVFVFGLRSGHSPDDWHCVALACSAGCHRSLSIAIVLAFVFGMSLWAPSLKKGFDDPAKIPVLEAALGRKNGSLLLERIKELCEHAELKPFVRSNIRGLFGNFWLPVAHWVCTYFCLLT